MQQTTKIRTTTTKKKLDVLLRQKLKRYFHLLPRFSLFFLFCTLFHAGFLLSYLSLSVSHAGSFSKVAGLNKKKEKKNSEREHSALNKYFGLCPTIKIQEFESNSCTLALSILAS